MQTQQGFSVDHRTDKHSIGMVKFSSGKYVGEIFGVRVTARTLPEFFEIILNIISHVAPEVLVYLSVFQTQSRRFVAASPELVHLDNPNLPVMKTASGWWISKNIGQEDLKRALRALCYVSGLKYGGDVIFSDYKGSPGQ